MKHGTYDKTKTLDFQQSDGYLYAHAKYLRERIKTLENENRYLKRVNYCMLFLISITFACVVGLLGVMLVS